METAHEFGSNLAIEVVSELEAIALTVEDIVEKQRRRTSANQRAIRAIELGATIQRANGASVDQVEQWKADCFAGFTAAMDNAGKTIPG